MRRAWRSTPARPAISDLQTRYSGGQSEPRPTRGTLGDTCTSGGSREADVGSARSAVSAAAESQHMTMRWDTAASDSEAEGTPSGHAAPSNHRSPFGCSGGMQHAVAGLAESGGSVERSALAHGASDAAVQSDADRAEDREPGESDGRWDHTTRIGSRVRQLPVQPARSSTAGKPPGRAPNMSAVLARTRARAGRARGGLASSGDSLRAPVQAAGIVSPFAAASSGRAAQSAVGGLRPLTGALAGAAQASMPSHGSGGSGSAELPTARSGQSVASAVSAASEADGKGRSVSAAAASFWAAAADDTHASSVRHNP